MTGRAVSTVLDVTLALLLVSAGTVVLATAPSPPNDTGPGPARTAANLLSTTDATVEYRHSTGGAEPERRTANGTVATLLADAALVDARTGGTPPFVERVENATERTVRRVTPRAQVVAVWTPYPGAPVVGRVAAGRRPPPDADVDAVTLTVPVGTASGDAFEANQPQHTATDGFGPLARNVSRDVVGTLFPPAGAHPLQGTERVRQSTRAALTGFAEQRGVTLPGLSTSRTGPVNRRLADALTPVVRADLERRFESPRAAAAALTGGHVTVVVRTWSR
ncbi:hypothetical protein ACFQH6_05170 [Halobacteriaceae archaeon GCM10025711]